MPYSYQEHTCVRHFYFARFFRVAIIAVRPVSPSPSSTLSSLARTASIIVTMVARLSPTTRLFVLIGLAVVVHQRHHVAAQEEENNSIQTCADLIAAITEDTPTTTTGTTTTTTSFNLTSDITCSDYILIASGQNITIYGAAAANTNATTTTTTITIATEFLANNASQSLLEVQEWGSLTLDGITFVREEEYVGSEEELQLLLPVEGIRAVHNMGTLTVNNCVFDGLNSLVENPLSQGGAVSACSK